MKKLVIALLLGLLTATCLLSLASCAAEKAPSEILPSIGGESWNEVY